MWKEGLIDLGTTFGLYIQSGLVRECTCTSTVLVMRPNNAKKRPYSTEQHTYHNLGHILQMKISSLCNLKKRTLKE